MKEAYYWSLVVNYALCYLVFGAPLVISWALLSSTSAYLYTYVCATTLSDHYPAVGVNSDDSTPIGCREPFQ